jgi:uncharacterized protein GlcG (DUF336 family)
MRVLASPLHDLHNLTDLTGAIGVSGGSAEQDLAAAECVVG